MPPPSISEIDVSRCLPRRRANARRDAPAEEQRLLGGPRLILRSDRSIFAIPRIMVMSFESIEEAAKSHAAAKQHRLDLLRAQLLAVKHDLVKARARRRPDEAWRGQSGSLFEEAGLNKCMARRRTGWW
jgi:hypothetical protein